jgi:hypothetical protein
MGGIFLAPKELVKKAYFGPVEHRGILITSTVSHIANLIGFYDPLG